MPGRKELNVGVVRPESALIGKRVKYVYEEAGASDLEIIAILRGADVMLPNPDSVLQESDRLLIIGSSKARNRIAEHLASVEASKVQLSASSRV